MWTPPEIVEEVEDFLILRAPIGKIA